jgi:hypothetical protein
VDRSVFRRRSVAEPSPQKPNRFERKTTRPSCVDPPGPKSL